MFSKILGDSMSKFTVVLGAFVFAACSGDKKQERVSSKEQAMTCSVSADSSGIGGSCSNPMDIEGAPDGAFTNCGGTGSITVPFTGVIPAGDTLSLFGGRANGTINYQLFDAACAVPTGQGGTWDPAGAAIEQHDVVLTAAAGCIRIGGGPGDDYLYDAFVSQDCIGGGGTGTCFNATSVWDQNQVFDPNDSLGDADGAGATIDAGGSGLLWLALGGTVNAGDSVDVTLSCASIGYSDLQIAGATNSNDVEGFFYTSSIAGNNTTFETITLNATATWDHIFFQNNGSARCYIDSVQWCTAGGSGTCNGVVNGQIITPTVTTPAAGEGAPDGATTTLSTLGSRWAADADTTPWPQGVTGTVHFRCPNVGDQIGYRIVAAIGGGTTHTSGQVTATTAGTLETASIVVSGGTMGTVVFDAQNAGCEIDAFHEGGPTACTSGGGASCGSVGFDIIATQCTNTSEALGQPDNTSASCPANRFASMQIDPPLAAGDTLSTFTQNVDGALGNNRMRLHDNATCSNPVATVNWNPNGSTLEQYDHLLTTAVACVEIGSTTSNLEVDAIGGTCSAAGGGDCATADGMQVIDDTCNPMQDALGSPDGTGSLFETSCGTEAINAAPLPGGTLRAYFSCQSVGDSIDIAIWNSTSPGGPAQTTASLVATQAGDSTTFEYVDFPSSDVFAYGQISTTSNAGRCWLDAIVDAATCTGITDVCGDGNVTGSEICDDGNTAAGDGCDASCAIESGFVCAFGPAAGPCTSGGPSSVVMNGVVCSGVSTATQRVPTVNNAANAEGGPDGATAVFLNNNASIEGTVSPAWPQGGTATLHFRCGTAGAGFAGRLSGDGGATSHSNWSATATTPGVMETATISLAAGDVNYTYFESQSNDCEIDALVHCSVPVTDVCGDGVVTGAELCDDGNTAAGDGCDATCALEAGFVCASGPAAGPCTSGGPGSVIMGGGGTSCNAYAAIATATGGTCTNIANMYQNPDNATATCTGTADITAEPNIPWPAGTVSMWGQLTAGDSIKAAFYADTGCTNLVGQVAFVPPVSGAYGEMTATLPAAAKCVAFKSDNNATINIDAIVGDCGAADVCGDGMVTGTEICDDGNTANGDGCRDNCVLEFGWECDAGPAAGPCTSGGAGSVVEVCGNGATSTNETCDDGNTLNGDGCSSTCAWEPGYSCTGNPSICTSTCGDGVVAVGQEICDDGNTAAGDGCDASCALETGYVCTSGPAAGPCGFGGPGSVATVCGDGIPAGAEACDDMNTAAGDGCSASCTVESGWSCTGAPSTCTMLAACGDGNVDSGETCDDGNTAAGDGCDASCGLETGYVCNAGPAAGPCTSGGPGSVVTSCGDGVVAGAEICDDANTAAGDGCDATCALESGFVCTVGPAAGPCGSGGPGSTSAVCGDGIIAGAEACDDMNTAAGDGCSASCTVESGWSCTGAPSTCTMLAACGDGNVDSGETCDDGNTAAGDGCDASCGLETGYVCNAGPAAGPCTSGGPGSVVTSCGDGVVAGAEICDDANTAAGDGCDATCALESGFVCTVGPAAGPCGSGGPGSTSAVCGDGIIAGAEACDDMNTAAGDGCSASCAVETGWTCTGAPSVCVQDCGDGDVDSGETCDDGNLIANDGCDASCGLEPGYQCVSGPPTGACTTGGPNSVAEICGDGQVVGTEQCDDGNTTSGDGCDATCETENGYTCMGAPSICTATCGDGVVAGTETCDDNNIANGDGCDSSCALESGYACNVGPVAGPCGSGGPGSVVTVCGDGVVAGAEICDDANVAAGDGCDATCALENGFQCTVGPAAGPCGSGGPGSTSAVCGDGMILGTEQCDDMNTAAGDGCDATCMQEAGWACTGAPSVCSMLASCGDGNVDSGEFCDDGNMASGDGCDASCAIETGYQCAMGPAAGPCTSGGAGSVITVCGDGAVGGTEVCDDGNTAAGDGCDATCAIEPGFQCTVGPAAGACGSGGPGSTSAICGDGQTLGAETCDDGNTTAGDGCDATCEVETGFVCTGAPSSCSGICGDSTIVGAELCDDGNVAAGDGCDATCAIESGYVCTTGPAAGPCGSTGAGSVVADCGDGIVTGAELCDDGNTAGGDGCDATCAIETGFQCTVGPAAGPCASGGPGSTSPICGDGAIVGTETCDDMNTATGDGCDATCMIEAGWSCSGAPSVCTMLASCGDGTVDSGEFCDDGNTAAGDGCDASCGIESGYVCNVGPAAGPCGSGGAGSVVESCGDGVITMSEVCDDGNTAAGDGCDATCALESGFQCVSGPPAGQCTTTGPGSVAPTCGDGVIVGTETCDDMNTAAGDGCDATCMTEAGWNCTGAPSVCTMVTSCGDGTVDMGETCDDGNTTSGDGCDASCALETGYQCTTGPATGPCGNGGPGSVAPICGDGMLLGTETCDDMNTATGDGCDATCMIEAGWTCSGTPSVCVMLANCGDGAVDALETCDDGNTTVGDGCDASCALEPGYQCATGPFAGPCGSGGPGSVVEACGDGVITGSETCDDGNALSGDGCDALCELESGYQCTTGPAAGPCGSGGPGSTSEICGDGLLVGMESCDDGNMTIGDGCDDTCLTEAGWTCTGAPSTCTMLASCGDGTVDMGEFCDDGNNTAGDGCDASCVVEAGYQCLTGPLAGPCGSGGPGSVVTTCGDGVVAGTETCDDGNTTSGDGCDVSCDLEVGYQCATGPAAGPCGSGGPGSVAGICGDGQIVGAETCDDGNTTTGDGCDATCMTEPGWTCTGAPSVCTALASCGDGVVDAGEFCDDGNTAVGDGCDASCVVETGFQCATGPAAGPCGSGGPGSVVNVCGDGIVTVGETCDDGNTTAGDGCDATCLLETGWQCVTGPAAGPCGTGGPGSVTGICGDGMILGAETCDDANTVGGDGCDVTCTVEPAWTCTGMPSVCQQLLSCGDGVIDALETCDDGNTFVGDGCDASCAIETGYQCAMGPAAGPCGSGGPGSVAATCGDGLVVSNETCDDGNTTGGDGCDMVCMTEPGWTCVGTPSVCTQPSMCGDGALDIGETCDDGNGTDGDGCDSSCAVESGWVCIGAPSVCYIDTDNDGIPDNTDPCPTDPTNTCNDWVVAGGGCDSSNPMPWMFGLFGVAILGRRRRRLVRR